MVPLKNPQMRFFPVKETPVRNSLSYPHSLDYNSNGLRMNIEKGTLQFVGDGWFFTRKSNSTLVTPSSRSKYDNCVVLTSSFSSAWILFSMQMDRLVCFSKKMILLRNRYLLLKIDLKLNDINKTFVVCCRLLSSARCVQCFCLSSRKMSVTIRISLQSKQAARPASPKELNRSNHRRVNRWKWLKHRPICPVGKTRPSGWRAKWIRLWRKTVENCKKQYSVRLDNFLFQWLVFFIFTSSLWWQF